MKHFEYARTRRKESILRRARIDLPTVWSWTALIVAALIAFGATRGTQYHQLAVGILLSSITLLVLLSVFELLWRGLEAVFGRAKTDASNRTERRG